MELEAAARMGDMMGDMMGDEPAPAPTDGQQTSAPLIMIETDGTDVCAADGSGC